MTPVDSSAEFGYEDDGVCRALGDGRERELAGLKFTGAVGRLPGVGEWSSADVASRRFVWRRGRVPGVEGTAEAQTDAEFWY